MCGNIKKLRFADREALPEEIEKAAWQYVKKISNCSKPSQKNQVTFERSVKKISKSLEKMLANLEPK